MDGLGKIFALFWLIIGIAYSYHFYQLAISTRKNRFWYAFFGFLIGIGLLLFLILTISTIERFVLRNLFGLTLLDFKNVRWFYMIITICLSVAVLLILKNTLFRRIIGRRPKNEIEDIGVDNLKI